MKIKKIRIKKFRALENVEYDLGESLNVFEGDNQLGKSTIIDAAMWVLCNETLVNGKNDADNRDMLNIKEPLEVALDVVNDKGEEYELKRVYKDVWKVDADGNDRFSSNSNVFYINGSKAKVKEFADYLLGEIGLKNFKVDGFNLLRAITDYNYFNSLDTKVLRKFIESLLNLKSDEEILSDNNFAPIQQDMRILKNDTGKVLNKYQDAMKIAGAEIEKKEVLKESLQKEFEDEEIEKLDDLKANKQKLLNSDVKDDEEYKQLNGSLEEIDNNIQTARENAVKSVLESHTKALDEIVKEKEAVQKELNELNGQKEELANQINELENANENLKQAINNVETASTESAKGYDIKKQRLQEEIEKYNIEIKVVATSEFEPTFCPHCGKIVNEKEADNFEENKKKTINDCSKKIKDLEEQVRQLDEEKNNLIKGNEKLAKVIEDKKKLIAEIEKELEDLRKQQSELEPKIASKQNEISELNNKYAATKSKFEDEEKEIQETEEIKALKNKKLDIQNKIEEFTKTFVENKNEAILKNDDEIYKILTMVEKKKQYETIKDEIAKLRKEKATSENNIDLVREFTRLKSNMIEENTKLVFPDVDIKLLELNIKSNVTKEVCYATLNDVEYKAINDGHRYLVGIRIIEDVKKAMGLRDLPIIFDKFGDIGETTLAEIRKATKAQILSTRVTNDKEIKLVKGE